MRSNNKSWWFVTASIAVILVIIAILVISLWHQLPSDQRAFLYIIFKQHLGYICIVVFFLLAGLGLTLDGIFRNYIIPINKLAEETALIHSVNPSHRIRVEGGREVSRLVQIINEGADRFEELQKNVDQKIHLAKAETEEEKNVLAAIMSELPEGVLICNAEGQILLYNKQARQFLEGDDSETSTDDSVSVIGVKDRFPIGAEDRFIGLGRSVFGVIDKNLVVHVLDEIADKLERKEANAVSHFVAVGKGDRLLRAEAVPILNHMGQFTGFILIFEDITKQIETDSRVDFLLQYLTTGIRTSLASIRAAIEAILEEPDMDSDQLSGFRKIIHKESLTSGAILDETALDYSSHVRAKRPLVQMLGKDLLETIKRKAEDKLDISINIENSVGENWVKVDSYSIVLVILFVLNRLRRETGTREFICKLERKGKFANLDLIWWGKPLKIKTLREWEGQVLIVGKEGIPSTLKEVIEHHEAKMWPATLREAIGDEEIGMWPYSYEISRDKSGLRLFLPDVEVSEPDTIRNITVVPESRPEFYDFDLFNQPGQIPELDNHSLTELTYTVFDTETTGLSPKGGDEIISVGAVRIVNCRLLREELFDQLVDPQRLLPRESIQIHGIQPEMLKDQPTINKVLPSFYRFAEDTILVAHNAAFDMSMLQMKEAISGVKFINPVLDTLLLSAVVHPAQDNHNLEAIAKRLGISVVGRHTALGDAIVTGEMFLKLIPLLAKMGIHTLREARLASQKTYYARLKY